jgi:hypothetical protein
MMSGPPPASSWAAPPEFYVDENTVTRSVRRRLTGLGYVIHTPAELYGSRDAAEGVLDEDWLPRVGTRGWIIIGRDAKIYERPHELAAYQRARVQVFLLPGEAKAAELVELLELNLEAMCAIGSSRQPGTWRLTANGLRPFPVHTSSKPGGKSSGRERRHGN